LTLQRAKAGKMQVGDECEVVPGFRKGVVAYVGAVAGLPEGEWVGVRLEEATGKNDGTRDGVRYFECEPNHGAFTTQKNLRAPSDRKATLTSRFAKSNTERQTAKDVKNAARDVNIDPTESIDLFWKQFKVDEGKIRSALDSLTESGANDETSTRINELQMETQQMQKSAAEASRYLPPFDVRQTQELVTALTSSIEETRASLAPRKKFSFRARARVREQKAKAKAKASDNSEGTSSSETIFESKKAVVVEIPLEGFRFENQCDTTLQVEVGQLDNLKEGQGKDGCLSHLKNCTIFIMDVSEAIRVDHLENCKVYVGAVAGSVHLQHCKDCTFMIASRQIRIHDSYDCDYYLHVASNPIFEDCARLRFGPYNLYYPEQAAQMAAAGLAHLENQWKKVDDFKWHRAQHSPNWAALKEEEMVTGAIQGSAVVRIGPPPAPSAAPNNEGQPAEDDESDDEL
jgi:hypothetical protein